MNIFTHDTNLKHLEDELIKTDIKICKDAANLKELQKKHPELKQICENYNNSKKNKENHIEKLLEYLDEGINNTVSDTVIQQLNLEKKTLNKLLEQIRKF